jgi:stalled ribosome rescue protein Dom34
MSHHAVVWLDHENAKIFHFTADSIDPTEVRAENHHVAHRGRHKGAEADQHFMHEVAHALAGAARILIVGPGSAKLELIRHIHKHDRELEPRVVGVETVDHPTDRQLVAYAKKYFEASDRMRGNV